MFFFPMLTPLFRRNTPSQLGPLSGLQRNLPLDEARFRLRHLPGVVAFFYAFVVVLEKEGAKETNTRSQLELNPTQDASGI